MVLKVGTFALLHPAQFRVSLKAWSRYTTLSNVADMYVGNFGHYRNCKSEQKRFQLNKIFQTQKCV